MKILKIDNDLENYIREKGGILTVSDEYVMAG